MPAPKRIVALEDMFPTVAQFLAHPDRHIHDENLLHIRFTQKGDAAKLMASKAIDSIDILNVSATTDALALEGAQVIAASPKTRNFKDLRFTPIPAELDEHAEGAMGDEGVKALAASKYLDKTDTLIIHTQKVGTEGAKLLADAPTLGHVTHLQLWGNQIGDEGARALANSKTLRPGFLGVAANNITDDGAKALAATFHGTHLWLMENRIGDEGAKALATAPNLKNLQALYLDYNAIGNEGARAFGESKTLPSTGKLELQLDHNDGINDQAVRMMLQKRFGKDKVTLPFRQAGLAPAMEQALAQFAAQKEAPMQADDSRALIASLPLKAYAGERGPR